MDDYYAQDVDEGSSNLSHGQLVMRWKSLWFEMTGVNPAWGIKETTLLSKLMKRYSGDQIVEIMDNYIGYHPGSFGHCYQTADEHWAAIQKSREGYQWS